MRFDKKALLNVWLVLWVEEEEEEEVESSTERLLAISFARLSDSFLSFLFSIPSEKLRLRLRLLDGGVAVAKYPGVQYSTVQHIKVL